jgi:hypothetical protein
MEATNLTDHLHEKDRVKLAHIKYKSKRLQGERNGKNMPVNDFEDFRQWIFDHPETHAQLRALRETAPFTGALEQIASDHGFQISCEQIEAAMHAGRTAWLQRWMWW